MPASVGLAIRAGGVAPAFALMCCAPTWLLGCSPKYHKGDADREAYGILAAKQSATLGVRRPFTVEPPAGDPLEELRRERGGDAPASSRAPSLEELGLEDIPDDGLPERPGAILLTLGDALRLAARLSRDYQSRKEALYLAALGLSLERFAWTPQWTGSASGGATDAADDSLSAGSAFSVSQLLALGGEFSVRLATDLLKVTTGERPETATTSLAIDVLQPLWRRAGRLVARENLTQAERDVVYAVRSFARFRRTFCVSITSDYYGVLRARDAVTNQWQNYLQNREAAQRTQDMAAAGRLRELDGAQARQRELQARDSWVQALQSYYQQLDRFKVTLGVPTEAALEVDPAEIDRLRAQGVRTAAVSRDEAIGVALGRRLDLLTAFDQVTDAERKVLLAENGLGPDVDLRLSADVSSAEGNRPAKLQFHRATYTAALDADLPLNRQAERNAYRRSLISLEQARRQAEELRDEVKLDVRQAWRNLLETATRYQIQEDSVRLAERRVEGEALNLLAGEAKPRDLLEANQDLVRAKNALTGALIDNTLARLALWRDTELLRVGEDGVWKEVTDVE